MTAKTLKNSKNKVKASTQIEDIGCFRRCRSADAGEWDRSIMTGWVFFNNDFPQKTGFSNDFMLKSAQK